MTTRGEHDRDKGEHAGKHRGEHGRAGRGDGAEHGGEGEESGTELALNERCDGVRNGVRLVMSYDARRNVFTGAVENTTGGNLEQVRVEVHLSSGVELGPTTPADLAPGEKKKIELEAPAGGFEKWTAHPEAGRSEHGHGEEGGKHDR